MQKVIARAIAEISNVVLGKEQQIKLALACIFARGHLLVEDLPGMGKTTLSHALAIVMGLEYQRVQFTSDLLPADILGVSIFDQKNSEFHFHPGPIFTQVLLADEINRTTPKTQSALLEAMEEYQVTTEGQTRPLPRPFFVIATQNPLTQSGTFPLPESQLDRFLMRIELGYPDPSAERLLLQGEEDPRKRLKNLKQVVTVGELEEIQDAVGKIKTTDSLLDYVQRLTKFTRVEPEFSYGISPRGALALLRCAKTWALMEGRSHVIPEDVQAVLPSVVGHRLREASNYNESSGRGLAQRLLNSVDVVG